MILKKPYAFLIKYFKLIHICLFILFGYLLFKLRDIYTFFQEYVKNDVYTYMDNMASKYIGVPLFLIAIFILVAGIAIFYLMRSKEKPVLFYRILIAYSFTLFITLIVYNNFYISLEYEVYDRTIISIYRDIIGFFYYAIYSFVAISFVRGFGFDIKKFSFEKDIKELNITDTDSEEFELSVNIDKETLISNLRKEKRLVGYFIKENIITLSIIFIIMFIILGIYVYNNIIVTNIVYSQNKLITANNVEYMVNKSYFTHRDKENSDLNYDYVVIDLTMNNKNNSNLKLNLMKMRIKIGNKFFYPVTNQYTYFNDLGVGYKNNVLKSNTASSYIFVFKIDQDIVSNKNIIFQIFDKEEYSSNNVKTIYQQIKLKPIYDNDTTIKTIGINDLLSLENTLIEKGTIKVLDYQIANKFIEKYEECIEDKCQKYDKVVQGIINNDVIKLKCEDEELDDDFFENYASFVYEINGNTKIINESSVKVLYRNDDAVFLEINRELRNANKIILEFNIRGNIYQIILKDINNNSNG